MPQSPTMASFLKLSASIMESFKDIGYSLYSIGFSGLEQQRRDIEHHAGDLINMGLFQDYFTLVQNGYSPTKSQHNKFNKHVEAWIASAQWHHLFPLMKQGLELTPEQFSHFLPNYLIEEIASCSLHRLPDKYQGLLNFLGGDKHKPFRYDPTEIEQYMAQKLQDRDYQQALCHDLVEKILNPKEKHFSTLQLYNTELYKYPNVFKPIVQHMDESTHKAIVALAQQHTKHGEYFDQIANWMSKNMPASFNDEKQYFLEQTRIFSLENNIRSKLEHNAQSISLEELPVDIKLSLGSIQEKLALLSPDRCSEELFNISTQELPQALSLYFSMPAPYRATMRDENKQTASDKLIDSLIDIDHRIAILFDHCQEKKTSRKP